MARFIYKKLNKVNSFKLNLTHWSTQLRNPANLLLFLLKKSYRLCKFSKQISNKKKFNVKEK